MTSMKTFSVFHLTGAHIEPSRYDFTIVLGGPEQFWAARIDKEIEKREKDIEEARKFVESGGGNEEDLRLWLKLKRPNWPTQKRSSERRGN